MIRAAGARKRQQGSIDQLPSGALRVRIHAGVDPVTKRRHDLIEIIPAGPDAQRRAEDARLRLLAELRERRNPRTNATVDQLLDRYLALHSGGKTTLSDYRTADPELRPWADEWVERIGALYGAHTAVTAAEPGSSAYRWATAQFSAALGGQRHRPHRLAGRQQDQTPR